MQSDLRGQLDRVDRTVVLTHHAKHSFALPVARQAISPPPPGPAIGFLAHPATFPSSI